MKQMRNQQLKILIVDDNPDEIVITRRVLAKMGCEVKTESSEGGEEALESLRNCKDLPAVILLDLKMPGLSGIDMLRRIRSDERLKQIPIIVVTSSALEADRRESLEAGANSFIHKVFDLEQFGKELIFQLDIWLKPANHHLTES
jgi:two-component system, response regulator